MWISFVVKRFSFENRSKWMKDKQIKNFSFTFTKFHCMHPVSLSFKENGHSNMSYSEDITCTLKALLQTVAEYDFI